MNEFGIMSSCRERGKIARWPPAKARAVAGRTMTFAAARAAAVRAAANREIV